jgi:hypothetical protein
MVKQVFCGDGFCGDGERKAGIPDADLRKRLYRIDVLFRCMAILHVVIQRDKSVENT